MIQISNLNLFYFFYVFPLGKFIGARGGIEIKQYFGDRSAWRLLAGIAFVVSVAYFVIVRIYRYRRRRYDMNNPVVQNNYKNWDTKL